MVLSDRDAFFLALPGRQLMHVGQTRRVASPAGRMWRSGPPWPAAGSCFGAGPDANTLVRARPWVSSHVARVTGGRLPGVAPGTTPGMPTSISSGCRTIVCRHICHWKCRNSFFNKDKKRLWRNNKNAKLWTTVLGEFRPQWKLLYALGLRRAPWALVWSLANTSTSAPVMLKLGTSMSETFGHWRCPERPTRAFVILYKNIIL